MSYRYFFPILLVCLTAGACGSGGGAGATGSVGAVNSAPEPGSESIGSLLTSDLAGTPRAQPSPTMGALEVI